METEYFGLLIGVAFVAGVIDSIAGGGGLLTLPAFLFAGVPPVLALGTNKFVGTCGTLVAVLNFARKKLINWKILTFGAGFTVAGGLLGSRAILLCDPAVIQVVVLVCLPLAAGSLFLKKPDLAPEKIRYAKQKTGFLALGMGFYDGFFGPGTGTFLVVGLHHVLGLNLVHATALAKPFNLISSISALIMFGFYGKVIWSLALPLAACSMLGNWAGSHLAMKQGAFLVRRALISVCILLFVSLAIKLSLVYEWLSY
ncbi:MAG: TSUP family transporter [Myxococcaceae bacterium]